MAKAQSTSVRSRQYNHIHKKYKRVIEKLQVHPYSILLQFLLSHENAHIPAHTCTEWQWNPSRHTHTEQLWSATTFWSPIVNTWVEPTGCLSVRPKKWVILTGTQCPMTSNMWVLRTHNLIISRLCIFIIAHVQFLSVTLVRIYIDTKVTNTQRWDVNTKLQQSTTYYRLRTLHRHKEQLWPSQT